jgi:hypothetical protein
MLVHPVTKVTKVPPALLVIKEIKVLKAQLEKKACKARKVLLVLKA